MQRLIYLSLIAFALVACGHSAKQGEAANPNFRNGIYINNHVEHPDKNIFSFLRVRWFGDEKWADHEKQKDDIPQTPIKLPALKGNAGPQVTWLGHSTFLIQHQGLNILTDPMFSERASPVGFLGPKRFTQVAAQADELPPIDIVIISHNHYDHLDVDSIKTLGNTPVYYVPSGLKVWFSELGIDEKQVSELPWWQSDSAKISNNADTKFTALPSQHWSARGFSDRHKSHWASWLMELGELTFWFAGDTGYNEKDFVDIGNYIKDQGKALDVALIPIGAYAPRDFMKTYHVNTEEAVQIHHDINARLSIGMHWGTFPLTAEEPMEPYRWLNEIREKGNIAPDTAFVTLKIGETLPIN